MAAIAKERRDSPSESRAFRAFAPRKCGFPRFSSQEWDIMKTVMRTANFASFNGRAELHGFHASTLRNDLAFDVEARQLAGELRTILGIDGLSRVRLINRCDVEGISSELFDQCVPTVFSEPQVDVATAELPVEGATIADDGSGALLRAWRCSQCGIPAWPVRPARADSASECVQLIIKASVLMCAPPRCTCSRASFPPLMLIPSSITSSIRLKPVRHLLRRARLCICRSGTPIPSKLVDGFIDLDEAGLEAFLSERGLAMDLADITFFQSYFKKRAATPPLPR